MIENKKQPEKKDFLINSRKIEMKFLRSRKSEKFSLFKHIFLWWCATVERGNDFVSQSASKLHTNTNNRHSWESFLSIFSLAHKHKHQRHCRQHKYRFSVTNIIYFTSKLILLLLKFVVMTFYSLSVRSTPLVCLWRIFTFFLRENIHILSYFPSIALFVLFLNVDNKCL